MTQASEKAQKALESLQTAVTKALATKKRLGQYAVVWRNGKIEKLHSDIEEAPLPPQSHKEQ